MVCRGVLMQTAVRIPASRCREAAVRWKGGWSYAAMECGGLSVIMTGMCPTHEWSADSWGSLTEVGL